MDLNALRSALAVADHGGIGAACRATGIPRSTLSRHLADLERVLGVRLVERSSRRFRLTDAGTALATLARAPLASLAQIEDQFRPADAALTGRLRISVPVLFAAGLLAEVAATFSQAHPGVFLDAVVDDRHVDLLGEGFDAAIRVNPAGDSVLSGRRLGRNRLLLVATPQLVQRVGYRSDTPETVTWPAVVRAGWGDDGRFDVEVDGRRIVLKADPRMALSSPIAMLDAVLGGVGAALLPQTLVRAHLDAGRLVAIAARHGPAEEVWIVHAAGRLPSRRVVALTEILVRAFAARA